MPRFTPVPLLAVKALDRGTGAQSVSVDVDEGREDIVVVRHQGDIFAFRNACPHWGAPLETLAGRFFTVDGERLLCSTHGAEFRLPDGMCVVGPCAGSPLQAVGIEIVNGVVLLVAL